MVSPSTHLGKKENQKFKGNMKVLKVCTYFKTKQILSNSGWLRAKAN